MASWPPWGQRASIFAQGNGWRRNASSREAAASKSASLGAASFVAGAQIFTLGVLLYYVPMEQLNMGLLLFLALCYNAAMVWNWAPNPGFVSDTEEPRSEEEKSILRWCRVCRLWQPLRAKHCEKCERCVRKYDHHCFWIGGCVGEANHLRFYLLLTITFIYLLYLFPNVMKCFKFRGHATMDAAMLRNFIPFILIVVNGFMAFLIFALWVVHCVLLVGNLTTWEFSSRHRITYLSSRKGNPFNRGLCSNISFLFQRQPINWSLVMKRSDSDLV
ncbi:putative palmitoyltransferase ZDHHC12 [Trypanosoma grayi]|uniref:putative palmitoyltransferase ZDHHC12 n=1 Tax=Trypanosoma grayi TaxID=71804 RepID=UPI0004F4A7A3|nr:putative palmitoyltransferase ZDHHC12 [Trypanosoma grayi]KEG13325.1 putative palmitoyltransferase ZDHHC12 [Trypanosoma grayi]